MSDVPAKRIGRPPAVFTDEQKEIARRMAGEGASQRKIREALGFDADTWLDIRAKNPSFTGELVRAQQDSLEDLADSLLTLVDEYQDVQKARLQSDNIKFLLAKRKPQVYGDRIDVNVTQQVDLNAAINEARNRIMLPPRDPDSIVEAEYSTISNTSDATQSDKLSVEPPNSSDDDIFS